MWLQNPESTCEAVSNSTLRKIHAMTTLLWAAYQTPKGSCSLRGSNQETEMMIRISQGGISNTGSFQIKGVRRVLICTVQNCSCRADPTQA